MWSGRNHPLYRELDVSFFVTLLRMPQKVKKLILQGWSVNTSGIPDSNESQDFKVEVVNKNLQFMAGPNPTNEDWLRLAVQHDELQGM